MFENNLGSPFISPNMPYNPMIRSTPMINAGNTMMGIQNPNMMGIDNPSRIASIPRGGGFLSSLFGKGTGNLLSTGTKFNFGNLLNNTSKALGVVREAIPIVKEVGPMMGNMKSILKIASVFKDETDLNYSTRNNTISNENNTIQNENINTNKNDTSITSTTTNITNNNEPNFFL